MVKMGCLLNGKNDKNKKIEIKFPKWKWWQVSLGLGIIYIFTNVDPIELLQVAKELLKVWLEG